MADAFNREFAKCEKIARQQMSDKDISIEEQNRFIHKMRQKAIELAKSICKEELDTFYSTEQQVTEGTAILSER